MSNALRMIVFSLLASTAVHAAEQPSAPRDPGTLSREATAAGPAVNTSAAAPAVNPNATAPAVDTSAGPAVDTSATSPAAAARPTRQPAAGGPQAVTRPSNDRLNLDTTTVTGNRELPKVLYIVPWKKSDLGALPAQPFNTLLDEALTPVDRDVFRREVTYYGAVSEGADGAAPQAERSEK